MSVVTYSGERVFFIVPVYERQRSFRPTGDFGRSSLQKDWSGLGVSIPLRPVLRSNA